jgi:hypothetical protein
MSDPRAHSAVTASGASLAVALACAMAFLPTMFERFLGSVPRIVGVSLVLATALLLHWAFLGIAARRMGRSVLGWVGLAVALFPIGGAAALVLLGWFSEDAPQSRRTAAQR